MTRHISQKRHAAIARHIGTIILGAMVLMGPGCASLPKPSVISESQAVPPLVMHLMPGDEVEVNFFGASELNTTQSIRRDGKISLGLVGDVMVAYKTPDQVKQEILQLYANQLQIQDVNLILRTPPPVLVSGAVQKAGRVPLSRPLTVLDAIMESGGFNMMEAEIRSVVLIRHQDGRRISYILDFENALSGIGQDKPFYLEPFDIVFVPQNRITKANAWVEQYINRMLPEIGMSYGTDGEVTFYR